MLRKVLRAKIHRARVTRTDLDYEESLTLNEELLQAADLAPFELAQVYNITNGNRFETYLIKGERGSGEVCINGAAAHLAKTNDLVIIASYTLVEEPKSISPKIVLVDDNNKITEIKGNK